MTNMLSEPSSIFVLETTDWVARIKWTTLARVIGLSGLLIFAITMDIGMFGPQGATRVPEVVLYQVVTTFFVLSFLALLSTYLLADRLSVWLAWATLTVDVCLAAAMVSTTHGTDSVFLFAMPLTVLSGAALLERKGAFLAATACSVLLTAIALVDMQIVQIDMEHHTAGWLRTIGRRGKVQPFGVLVTMGVQLGALYGTALLSSKFVQELTRARGREEAERRELVALRVRYEDVVSSLPDGLATVARNGTITSCNPAFARILGVSRDAALGATLLTMLPELDQKEATTTTVEIRREELDQPEEITRQSGVTQQVLAVKLAKLHGGANVDGTVLILRDVTQVRKHELAHRNRERLAAVGEMAMAVAHEIRNPLASISGTVQMLQSLAPPDETTAQLMEIAVRETEHLSSWIGDFLDFAKPGQKHLKPCDLRDIVQGKLMAFGQDPVVREAGIAVDLIAHENDYSLDADETKLASVVWNLLTNARQSVLEVEERQITVQLTATDEVLELRVADSGKGVPPTIREHIFEPFYTTKGEGTGLGLALVRRIVELHNGTIELTQPNETGAEFRVKLPRVAAQHH